MAKITPQEAKREYYRKWRETHKEQIKATNERYWARKAAEMDAAMAGKETEPREAKNAYYRNYRKEHRNELNAYYRNYRKEHPEAIAAAQLRFWAKKAAEIHMAEKAGRENAK